MEMVSGISSFLLPLRYWRNVLQKILLQSALESKVAPAAINKPLVPSTSSVEKEGSGTVYHWEGPDHVNQNSGSGTLAVAQPRLRIRAPRTVQGCWLTGKQSRCSHPAAVPSLTASGPLKLHCCCRESTESHVLTLTHPALGCARAWTLLDSWKEPSCFSPPPDFPSYFSLQLGESCQPLQV